MNDVAAEPVAENLPATTAASPPAEASIADLLQPKRELSPELRILLDPQLYEQVKRLAGIMSKDNVFTPAHLRGKAEACFTVINLALNWNLSPNFVARCTYQTPGGSIGFEGKLVQAALAQSNRFEGAPKFSYIGDWTKLAGKFEKATGARGGEYVKPTWTQDDAKGLGIIISWKVKGEETPRIWPAEGEHFWLTQCFPLNSPLWATDPKTQIRYLAIRRFADGIAPEILGGMPFDFDELIDASDLATDVTPPARPQRADYKDPAELVDDRSFQDPATVAGNAGPRPEDIFDIVDFTGTATEYTSVSSAHDAYQAALDEAEKQNGEAGLTLIWDNNQGFMRLLDERGHSSMSKQLSDQYGERRRAAANREMAQREAAEASKGSKAGETAASAVDNRTPPPPREQPAEASGQAKLGLGVPPNGKPKPTNLEPVIRDGKEDWMLWVEARLIPRIRQVGAREEMVNLMGDNGERIEKAKTAIPAATRKDLDAAINAQWDEIARLEEQT